MTEEKNTEPRETIHITTTIVLTVITTVLPLIGIYAISNTWWGILIKVVLAIMIFSMLKNYFVHPMYEGARIGAGAVFNMIWFTGLWFLAPHWSTYIFVALIMLSFATMKRTLKQRYDDAL